MKRALLIGLDSAPLSLVLPWMAKGHLPNMKRVFESGSYGDLFSNIPVTPVAWSTIYTGKNPGKHGVVGFKNLMQGTYREYAVSSSNRDARDIWDIVGAHGGKSVVVNAPLTYPPRPVNGYLVCGFMAPGTRYGYTYPKSLGEELKSVVPEYRIGSVPSPVKGAYLKDLRANVRMVGKVARHLMGKVEWDLAVVIFKETDEVQHSFFTEPGYMLSVYQEADRAMGELLELAGRDTTVFVVSDHGGERLEKRFNVAEFLRRKGYVKYLPAGPSRSTTLLRAAASTMYRTKLHIFLSSPGVRRVRDRILAGLAERRATGNDEGFYSGKIDWARTSVFISSGIGVRVNLRGREPEGSVDPADYEKVRSAIARELAEVSDPETGRTAFVYARPREEVLSGPHLAEAPDVVCLPNTGILPTEASSFDPLTTADTRASLFSSKTPFSGTHSPQGLVALGGPGVTPGRVGEASLVDIAPSILYAMGLPIPKGFDGRVLAEAFTEAHLAENPPLYEEESTGKAEEAKTLSEEESRLVEERLKKLGYLS